MIWTVGCRSALSFDVSWRVWEKLDELLPWLKLQGAAVSDLGPCWRCGRKDAVPKGATHGSSLRFRQKAGDDFKLQICLGTDGGFWSHNCRRSLVGNLELSLQSRH